MKKREIAISIVGIVFAFTVTVIIYLSSKDMTFKENGIMYAVNVNGKSQNSFPAKGLYKVDLSCENASCKWDYDNWKLYVDNITGAVACNITFTTITKTYLNNKIISFSGTTQGTGQVVNEKGYRYEGKNPNNYIWFNNELWRIIGVFDSASHGQSGKNLVKIIREEPLGGLVWNTSNTNDWSTSSLTKLLNSISGDSSSGAYYNKTNGTGNIYCYGYSTTVRSNCDYSQNGIDAIYRPMVKSVTWYLGGTSSTGTAETFYNAERGTTVYSGRPTSKTGYIGLMYPSDYGYSVLASDCVRTTNLSVYNKATCGGQSWLSGKGAEWTITHRSNSSNSVFHVVNGGNIGSSVASSGSIVRPVLYLDALVYVLDGDGSILNPYIIAK